MKVHTMQKWIRVVLLLLGISLANGHTNVSVAQSTESRIVYTQRLTDTKRVIVFGTAIQIDTILSSCTIFSPDLHYLAIAAGNGLAPDDLKVYDLDTGALLLRLPWDAGWEPAGCPLDWDSESSLSILNHSADPSFEQTKVNLNVLTGELSDPSPYVYLGMLTNRNPNSGVIRPSPDRSHYVYVRCNQPHSLAHGCPGSGEVIFDVTTQQVIVKLKNTSITPPNAAFPEFKYSWSSDGRYLAYPRGVNGLNIFDLQTAEYLDTHFLDHAPLLIDNTEFGIQWSPDKTRLMIFGDLFNPKTYDVAFGMSLINLQTQSVTSQVLDEAKRPIAVEQFAWLPDDQHILVVHDNLQMVRINANAFDQAGEVVAENVDRIWSWYSSN